MKDQSKTKQVLIQELVSLRQRIAELEKSELEGKRAEEALQQSESALKKAQKIGNMGHFSYDPVSSLVEGSDELFRIFDVDSHQSLFKAFREAVHPEDGHALGLQLLRRRPHDHALRRRGAVPRRGR